MIYNSGNLTTCGATILSGQLHVPGCKDQMSIHSLTGSHPLDCSKLSSAVWFGPITLESPDCYQSLEGLEFCLKGSADESQLDLYCDKSLSSFSICLITGLLLATLLDIVLIRWLCMRRQMSETVVAWAGVTTTVRPTKPQGGSGRRITMNWLRILIWALLFLKPSDSQVYRLSEGQSLSNGVDTLTMLEAHEEYTLTEDYKTFSWSTKMEWDWHSTLESCQRHIRCAGSQPHGVYTADYFWKKADDYVAYSRFCKAKALRKWWLPGDVCVEWLVQVTINPNLGYSVHSISNRKESLKTSTSGSCVVSHSRIMQSQDLQDGSVVITPSGEAYMCPFSPSFKDPRASRLGDIQVSRTWTFNIAKDIMSCDFNDEDETPECQITKPGILDAIPSCVILPGEYKGAQVRLADGILTSHQSLAAEVVLSCPIGAQPLLSQACGGTVSKLVGVADSPLGFLMVVKTNEVVAGAYWEGKVPCQEDMISIPCDPQGIQYMVPTGSSCVNEASSKMIADNVAFSRLLDFHTGTASKDSWSLSLSGLTDSLLERVLAGSWVTLIIAATIFLLVCRK